MRRMIRPMVKTPHAIASPIIKGVHVQVIGHLDSFQACWHLLRNLRMQAEPTILKRGGGPNANIIDPLASPARRILGPPPGITILRKLVARCRKSAANGMPPLL